jgi:hypothetical protein
MHGSLCTGQLMQSWWLSSPWAMAKTIPESSTCIRAEPHLYDVLLGCDRHMTVYLAASLPGRLQLLAPLWLQTRVSHATC